MTLEQDGSGWSWHEPDGDNRYYIEQIADCWYAYSLSF